MGGGSKEDTGGWLRRDREKGRKRAMQHGKRVRYRRRMHTQTDKKYRKVNKERGGRNSERKSK